MDEPCAECLGFGTGRAWFRLKPARTDKYRHVVFWPRDGRVGLLRLTTAVSDSARQTVERYAVEEFASECRGRTFYVTKLSTRERREAFLGADGSAGCTCEGTSYEAAGKADRRALRCGLPTFGSAGCVHLDALKALQGAGWLNLQSQGV